MEDFLIEQFEKPDKKYLLAGYTTTGGRALLGLGSLLTGAEVRTLPLRMNHSIMIAPTMVHMYI